MSNDRCQDCAGFSPSLNLAGKPTGFGSCTRGRYARNLKGSVRRSCGLRSPRSDHQHAAMPLRCQDCEHEWTEHFDLPMPVEQFVWKVKAIACSRCGSKHVLLRPEGSFYLPDESREERKT